MRCAFWMLLLFFGLAMSCTKDKDIVIPIEYELITSLTLTLVPEQGVDNQVRIFKVNDPDGPGGIAPTISSDTLLANTTYRATIELYDESGNEVIDVTPEIKATDKEHQFFFETTANITFEYLDFDSNNRPLGLITRASTGAASQASLTITLLHFPNKTAPGVAQGLIENAGGSRDIAVTFDLYIE